jgi:hypothetical protein
MSTADDYAHLFMGNACQYYATARFAMYAQLMPACGNLFHHAIEMSLKAGLAQKRKLSDLKVMGHKLKKLWRAFKEEFPDPALNRHDKTIKRVDKFEEIRYPGAPHSMGLAAEWSVPTVPVTLRGKAPHGKLKTPKQYAFVVNNIDDLIVDVFKAYSLNPDVLIGTNPATLEAINRRNAHSEYLTKTPAREGAGLNVRNGFEI